MPHIDHLFGIEIDETIGLNELTTLSCLSIGLAGLAEQVRIMEAPIIQYEISNRKKISFVGFDLLPPEDAQLVTCFFHWFGTTMCNYARLVGFLSGISAGLYSREQVSDSAYHAIVRKHCSDYVDSIPELEPIKIWRNKVFAHFAITDPRKEDNGALLDASVMSPITYFDGRLRVGGTVIGTSGSDIEFPHWSVTESYEALTPRFWPHLRR